MKVIKIPNRNQIASLEDAVKIQLKDKDLKGALKKLKKNPAELNHGQLLCILDFVAYTGRTRVDEQRESFGPIDESVLHQYYESIMATVKYGKRIVSK